MGQRGEYTSLTKTGNLRSGASHDEVHWYGVAYQSYSAWRGRCWWLGAHGRGGHDVDGRGATLEVLCLTVEWLENEDDIEKAIYEEDMIVYISIYLHKYPFIIATPNSTQRKVG